MSDNKWSYAETNEWGDKCKLPNQSPINIDSNLTQPCKELCELEFLYEPSKCLIEFIKHQNMKLFYDAGSGVIFKKNYYKLIEITFHTPSMHKIDGIACDLEVCLVHSLSDSVNDDDGLVVSCLYNSGKHYGNTEHFINQFINDVVINSKKEIEVSKSWSAEMLLPDYKSFFYYEGSVPYPPCSTNVNYIVMDKIGNIGPTNLELFKLNLGKNNRPIHSLNDRKVFYNAGSNIETLEQRVIKKSNDKFLRCKKVTDDKFKINEKKINEDTEVEKPDTGLSSSFKKNVKLISTIVVFLILIANAYFLAKYLFKYEYAQRLIISIVGIGSYKKGADQVYSNPNELLSDWKIASGMMTSKNTPQSQAQSLS